jgi:hypothetical protein
MLSSYNSLSRHSCILHRYLLATGHTENTIVYINVAHMLELPSNGLYDTVSSSNSIVVVTCLLRRCMATAVVKMFVLTPLPSNGSVLHNIEMST